MNYKKALSKLVRDLRSRGYKVKFVSSDKLKDYTGMNDEAGQLFGIKITEQEIWIDKSMTNKIKYETLRHEAVEEPLMEDGMKYWPAHKIALQLEK